MISWEGKGPEPAAVAKPEPKEATKAKAGAIGLKAATIGLIALIGSQF